MRNKDFEPITIASVVERKQMPHIEDSVVVMPSLKDLGLFSQARRMSLCLFIGVCTNGFASITVNDKKRVAEKNSVMLITDESVINDLKCSDDFDGFGIFISYQLLQEILKDIDNMSDLFLLTHNHPVFQLTEHELEVSLQTLHAIVDRIESCQHKYRLEVVRLLILTMIYDVSEAFSRILNHAEKEDKQNRSELIFVQFVQHVEHHFRQQRQVQWYANLMQLSPKYLCEVVSAVSKRSPNEWIDRFVLSEIRNQLRHTNKRISEIAKEMNFPTQSFFGKYFKDNVGVSPTDYRNGIEKMK